VHDWTSEETKAEHESGSPDEQHQTVVAVVEDEAGDVADPAIGPQLDVADQSVEAQQHGKHPVADGELREVAEDPHQDGSQNPAEDARYADVREPITEPQAN